MMDQAIKSYIEQMVRDALGQSVTSPSARTNYAIANWKMNKTFSEMAVYLQELKSKEGVSVVICPPSQLLYPAGLMAKQQGSTVSIGAQNVHEADKGAYTGEVSASMLKDIGCAYVIIGHSERRQYFNENDQQVNQKIKQAIKEGLTPIICIGETIEQKNSGQTEKVLTTQLVGALQDIDSDFILAYEPVWAIGTGESATAEQAQSTHAYIRKVLTALLGGRAEGISILYGGSVNDKNAAEFSQMPDIDGVLVGGASLNAESFEKIIAVFAKGDM
ncbi:triosephosphate isomerase [Bacillus tianshenii]|uniref:Triosephosphate isomerase n=1 Tax=Sutcliffiella tianshenii TaxID=1463404 RepID=A0ABS2NVW8_9BACI|nr:triose-phosphate isomerase [Bacillus tianshenii]MBM7618784.1 triosephosphate isomerase [Bacillus tianshenii]